MVRLIFCLIRIRVRWSKFFGLTGWHQCWILTEKSICDQLSYTLLSISLPVGVHYFFWENFTTQVLSVNIKISEASVFTVVGMPEIKL